MNKCTRCGRYKGHERNCKFSGEKTTKEDLDARAERKAAHRKKLLSNSGRTKTRKYGDE